MEMLRKNVAKVIEAVVLAQHELRPPPSAELRPAQTAVGRRLLGGPEF